MNARVYRIVFAAAGAWFLFGSVRFFGDGTTIGGVIFLVAGICFLGMAIRRRR